MGYFLWYLGLQPVFIFLWSFLGGLSGKEEPPDSRALWVVTVLLMFPGIVAAKIYKALFTAGFSLGQILRRAVYGKLHCRFLPGPDPP
ncbi:MAG: hypothetical protein Q8P59_07160 [Dehalococcoidia bacterium]|nr:hypothetical protein [Dehalococcoidia bacterium]